MLNECKVETAAGERPALEVLRSAGRYKPTADDPDKAEYFVTVQWLDTVPARVVIRDPIGLDSTMTDSPFQICM